jgi:hypothetical protein
MEQSKCGVVHGKFTLLDLSQGQALSLGDPSLMRQVKVVSAFIRNPFRGSPFTVAYGSSLLTSPTETSVSHSKPSPGNLADNVGKEGVWKAPNIACSFMKTLNVINGRPS